MATGSQSLPHLRLISRSKPQDYTPRRGQTTPPNLIQRERAVHGARILFELQNLQPILEQRKLARAALDIEAPDGITVEFGSVAGFDLVFESLDLLRSGIQLLNVRRVDNITYATCWIPDGKLNILVRKVTAYLNEDTKARTPNAKNANLVESIESIGVATITELWTDDEPIPDDDEVRWWELWLRTDSLTPENAFRRFEAAASNMQLSIGQQWLVFPERVVTNIKTTRTRLAQAIPLLNLAAEIRHADRPPQVPHSLTIPAQDEIVADIVARLDVGDDGVAVAIFDTGIARAHPLIAPILAPDDMHAVDNAWGTADHQGHGTKMAGVALYGDLRDWAGRDTRIDVPFRLESVKLLSPPIAGGQNDDQEILGAITAQAVFKCEIEAPERRRVICKAVTSDMHQRGEPSSYSAAIDQLAFNADDEDGRLFVISAGNLPDHLWLTYPQSNRDYGVEQPGQAWNALTVGAYTEKDTLPGTPDYAGWSALAGSGDLSPFSATSQSWTGWPMKPDVVFEGGNVVVDPTHALAELVPSLQLLTTNRGFTANPLGYFSMTSAATAQCAGLAGRLLAGYPDLWAETVRGMIIHHADWTQAQQETYLTENTQKAKRRLLRACGFGVPNAERVLRSAQHRVSLIAQESIQPYRLEDSTGKMNEMCIFQLPWPKEMLLEMQNTPVKLRVTLSYFVEPSPAKRGWTNRYRYASHGLRFDVRRNNEGPDEFNRRVNFAMRDAGEKLDSPGDSGWLLGEQLRRHGCVHSDIWSGMAIDLAERDRIAVYPVVGWWRQRLNRGRCTTRARFSLIVSLESENVDIKLYNAVIQELAVPIDLGLGL